MTLQLRDEDAAEHLAEVRAQLLHELAGVIRSLVHIGAHVAALRPVHHEFTDARDMRDGRDVATFVADSIRCVRAAHAVIEHTICEQATAC